MKQIKKKIGNEIAKALTPWLFLFRHWSQMFELQLGYFIVMHIFKHINRANHPGMGIGYYDPPPPPPSNLLRNFSGRIFDKNKSLILSVLGEMERNTEGSSKINHTPNEGRRVHRPTQIKNKFVAGLKKTSPQNFRYFSYFCCSRNKWFFVHFLKRKS